MSFFIVTGSRHRFQPSARCMYQVDGGGEKLGICCGSFCSDIIFVYITYCCYLCIFLCYSNQCSLSHYVMFVQSNLHSLKRVVSLKLIVSPLAIYIYLLLICDAVHNTLASQQCNTNPYCMVVLHACIPEPLLRSQPKLKIVRSATGSTEYGKPTLDLQVALSASWK